MSNDLSLLKNFNVKLHKDGSNLDAWLFKMKIIIKSKQLEPAVTMFLPGENEDDDWITVDPFVDRIHLPAIANTITQEQLEQRQGDDVEEKDIQTAYAYITTSIPDSLLYIYKDYPIHAGVAIARIREHFNPTDVKTKHQLYALITNARLPDYGHDFGKMAASMKEAASKLKGLGETLTETYLVSRLLASLVPASKYSIIKSIIQQKGDISFEEAVASIKSFLRDNNMNKKSLPLDPMSAMRMIDKNDKITVYLDDDECSYAMSARRPGDRTNIRNRLRIKALLRKKGTMRRRKEREMRNDQDNPFSRNKRKGIKCYYCKRQGHYSRNCFHNPLSKKHKKHKKHKNTYNRRPPINPRSYKHKQNFNLRTMRTELKKFKKDIMSCINNNPPTSLSLRTLKENSFSNDECDTLFMHQYGPKPPSPPLLPSCRFRRLPYVLLQP